MTTVKEFVRRGQAAQAAAQRATADALVGRAVRFAHQRNDAAYLITAAIDGMVELKGLMGLFAPHLFVVLDPLQPRDTTRGEA